MKYERSCGAVVFTRENGAVKYVIIASMDGYCGFPKGHMEPGETEHETARREIYEETGLEVSFIEGFLEYEEHALAREGRPDTMKQIVYFLAEYSGQMPRAQESEVSMLKLMDYDEAMNSFRFESNRRILRNAGRFIENM